MKKDNKNENEAKLEKNFFKSIFSMEHEEVKEYLKHHTFDFNGYTTAKGHGFLYTFLRRFTYEDILSEDISYKDIMDMIDIFLENGLTVNKETTTACRNPNFDFGSVLSVPVVVSVELKSTVLADYLLAKGADPNYKDSFGNIPLFFAEHYNLGTRYLELTKNIHHLNNNRENALFYQVRNIRVTKLLLGAGINPLIINSKGDSLALHCIRYGASDVLDYLLKNTDLDPNFTNRITLETNLFTVKHKKMLDMLVKNNANIHLLNDKLQTVLFTTNNKVSFVKTLIKYNLDINHQDEDGDTILHKPDTEGLIEILATNGFNFNIKNRLGNTVVDVYKKRNEEDLYSSHQNTIALILDKIQEQERIKKAMEKSVEKPPEKIIVDGFTDEDED